MFDQLSTTTTTPPRIGIMYWVRSVHHCLTSQAPLPLPHLVLELCIGLGFTIIVCPVKHHYQYPTTYWNYVFGWSVYHCLTSQAPLPLPHLVLELCIGLGLAINVWPVKHHYHWNTLELCIWLGFTIIVCPVKHHYHYPTTYWNYVFGWSVYHCLTSQAPLPLPNLVLELCIWLGLSINVWPVKHHYHYPTTYWNYVFGLVFLSLFDQSITTTTTPTYNGNIYWVRFVLQCLSS